MKYHEKIKKARMEAGLRLHELAELANLDLIRFVDIEMGTVKPTSGELRAIAEALNTTIADILGLPIRVRITETKEGYNV